MQFECLFVYVLRSYGDRSPTRFTSRLFAIIWTLYGMVLVSIITSAVTTSLTTVTVETTKKIYGLPVSVEWIPLNISFLESMPLTLKYNCVLKHSILRDLFGQSP